MGWRMADTPALEAIAAAPPIVMFAEQDWPCLPLIATLQNPEQACMMRAFIYPSIRIEGYMTQ